MLALVEAQLQNDVDVACNAKARRLKDELNVATAHN